MMQHHDLLIKTLMEEKARDKERYLQIDLLLQETDIVRQETIDQIEHNLVVKQAAVRFFAIVLIIVLLALGYSNVARAQTIKQLEKCPDSKGEIAELSFAILGANSDEDEDTIVLPPSCDYQVLKH